MISELNPVEDEDDFWGEGESSLPVPQPQPTGIQLSLFELFVIITLAACMIGIYIYVSRGLVIFLGALTVVIQAIRLVRGHYAVVGGLVGFGAAILVGTLTCALFQIPMYAGIGGILIGAVIAYPVGAIMTELSNDESI